LCTYQHCARINIVHISTLYTYQHCARTNIVHVPTHINVVHAQRHDDPSARPCNLCIIGVVVKVMVRVHAFLEERFCPRFICCASDQTRIQWTGALAAHILNFRCAIILKVSLILARIANSIT
jgi:hypothetical protein